MNRVCVYAICKNEINNIQRWLSEVGEADLVVVLDTGSTDGTWEVLQDANVICMQKTIEPFRFDVARNEALSMIPEGYEICLPLDIDMHVVKGFARALRMAWVPTLTKLIIPQYFKTNDTAGSWCAHARYGGTWKYPVYEQFKESGRVQISINTLIVHDFDPNKSSHKMYLPLADLALRENPNDPYCKNLARRMLNEQRQNDNGGKDINE